MAKDSGHDVLIAGGGPTGLMLAGELALGGVDVAIVERRTGQELAGLRAGGLQMRTLEVLDQRGIIDRFIAAGQKFPKGPFAGTILDIGDLPTRHSYFLSIWQVHVERILAEWVRELGVPTHRGLAVTGFQQRESDVEITLSDGSSRRARYLVGCDGGRSTVRKQAGIDFPGWAATTSYLIAEIDTATEPEWGFKRQPNGMSAIAKIDGGPRARVVVTEPVRESRDAPTMEDVRAALLGAYGRDFGLREATYVSRFTDATRQAAAYRKGRVLLAGDAAHVHSPMGGQGLNLGVQDAVNLGWKLAQVIRGESPDTLLDTYHAERHPVGARVLRNTMALTALERADERSGALREMLGDLMRDDDVRRRYFSMMSGLDIRYDLGDGHPWVGRRVPDLDLRTADGPVRTYELLHAARPVLIDLGGLGDARSTSWPPRLTRIAARADGNDAVPGAILVRPDGYVAWAGGARDAALTDALAAWCGAPG